MVVGPAQSGIFTNNRDDEATETKNNRDPTNVPVHRHARTAHARTRAHRQVRKPVGLHARSRTKVDEQTDRYDQTQRTDFVVRLTYTAPLFFFFPWLDSFGISGYQSIVGTLGLRGSTHYRFFSLIIVTRT